MDTVAIAEALGTVLGVDPERVTDLRRLTGGASRETWSVTVDGRPLVLQRERHGSLRSGQMGAEGALVEAAGRAGVPVPAVVARDGDESPLGSGYLITEFVEAETIARKIQRDDGFLKARDRFARDCGRALARIHRMDPSEHQLSVLDPVQAIRDMYADVDLPVPTFDLALRWLDDNRPADEDRVQCLVHGDFRLGNLMVDDDGLVAVIDWELAHVGDPVEDLGWLCTRAWRFGGAGAVGGIGDVEDLLDAYAAEAGRTVDPEVLRWYEVLGSLRWGVMCILQARVHLSGLTRSVELAAIGRRVVENEYDLFLLLAPDVVDRVARGLDAVVDTDPVGRPDLWPSSDQMLLAVEEFAASLRDSVGGAVGFGGRVAENVVAMIRREQAAAPAARDRTVARRRAWATQAGGDVEWVHADEALAGALADGAADATDTGLIELLAEWALDRLRIVNPKYLEARHRPA